MESCKIVYFMDYGKYFGGAYSTTLHQIVLMKKAGYSVIIFFSDYYGKEMSAEYQEICMQFGIHYEWSTYQISSQPEDIDIFCIDKNYENLRNKVADYNPDILHSVQINPCAEMVSRELDIPHIMNIYQLLPDFFSINYMNIFPYYHICDSFYYAEKWKQYLKTDSICIRTVAKNMVTRKGKTQKENVDFICVGVICKRKNQLSIIKAMHQALKYGIKGTLSLCGYADGEYYNDCRQYIEDNRLEDKIIFKGFCTDISVEYTHSDVLICGSTCESYPNAISEALANGLAIISTPVAGVPEIIEDGKNGYLTKDYSADALCKKIIQAVNDIEDGRIEEILSNAKNTFRENHSPQMVSAQLVKYYQHVLDDYRKQIRMDAVTIEEFRWKFHDIMECFRKHRSELMYPQEISKKLWYIYHISNIINHENDQGKKFFIWGAGKYGKIVKEMVDLFFKKITISGFIDTKKKGKIDSYKIYCPDEVISESTTIVFVASVNGQNEMINQLERMDKRFNKDYFILSARVW